MMNRRRQNINISGMMSKYKQRLGGNAPDLKGMASKYKQRLGGNVPQRNTRRRKTRNRTGQINWWTAGNK